MTKEEVLMRLEFRNISTVCNKCQRSMDLSQKDCWHQTIAILICPECKYTEDFIFDAI
jgi:hypothetical protein